jgi:hypothetical protein
MYAKGDIIYGSPVGEKAHEYLRAKHKDEMNVKGLTTLYSGSTEYCPAYAGVSLGDIDEATDAIRIDCDKHTLAQAFDSGSIDDAKPFSIKPTAKQKADARAIFNSLPKGLRKRMPPLGVYLVWYTS